MVRRLRRQGKTVAFTNGCFDLLHAGHLDTLERVKSQADILIVGVNSDSSVRRLKGPGRPMVAARDRARLVGGLKPVDWVVLFPEPTPLRLIRRIKPDLLAKGADWKKEAVVGGPLVESWGGRVITVPYRKGCSTSELMERIRRREPKEKP